MAIREVSLLLGMHKHQPETQGFKKKSLELNKCMLKLRPVTTLYIRDVDEGEP